MNYQTYDVAVLISKDTTHLFQWSFHCPKYFWNWLFGIANFCIKCFVLSPPCLETYSPSTAFSPLGIEKSHMGQCPVKGGLWHLWNLMFSQEVLGKLGWDGGGIVMLHLPPVTSLPWCMSFVPHRITQPVETFDVLFLVNSLTIWCVLIVDASVIEWNCQHHFHHAPNLVFLFVASEIP